MNENYRKGPLMMDITMPASDVNKNYLEWCEEYISITDLLIDVIYGNRISELDSCLARREEILHRLPSVIAGQISHEDLTFIDKIKELEASAITLINEKMNDILKQMSGTTKYRRNNNEQCKNSFSRYVDVRS